MPALLAGVVALAFVWSLLASSEGHFVPQVVDLYVIAQYAKAMAEGHPFQYNVGEPASSGATSLLHTALLGLAHAASLRGEGLIAFAIGLGALCYFASVALAGRLARRLAGDDGGERAGLLAASLLALGGPVVWGFFYGSDIALFMLLTLLVALRYVSHWEEARAAWAWPAALLALARPEGLPLGVLLGLGWGYGPGRRATRAQRLLAALPMAAGLGVLALQRALTGSLVGSSLADKSLVAAYGVSGSLALVSEYAVDLLRGLLLGFYPSQTPVGFARGWASLAFPPLGLIFVLVALGWARAGQATPLRVFVGAAALVAALTLPNTFLGVHFNRYVLWLFPLLLVLVAVGFSRLCHALARGDVARERRAFALGAALFGTLGLLSTLRFATLYGEMGGDLWRRDVAAAEWIRARLPPGTLIANAATSVEYLTGHRNLNLHGVTSPAFFGNTRAEREAGTFEALGRLARGERPAYLLTSVSVQDANESLRALQGGPPLFRSSSLGDDLLLVPLRWDVVERPRHTFLPATAAAVAGLVEVDRLNVCDRSDERDHGYAFESTLRGLPLHGAVRVATYPGDAEPVVDAGRVILGRERFELRSQAGRPLVLVLRTAPAASAAVLRPSGSALYGIELSEASLTLVAAGREVARTSLQPAAGWDEWLLRVPAEFVSPGRTSIELRGRYASFRYWAYQ